MMVSAGKNPLEVMERSNKGLILTYGYLDASRGGFGELLLIINHIHYWIGTWGTDKEDNSSNWREFENLVSGMEEAGKKGLLQGAVLSICWLVAACSHYLSHSRLTFTL